MDPGPCAASSLFQCLLCWEPQKLWDCYSGIALVLYQKSFGQILVIRVLLRNTKSARFMLAFYYAVLHHIFSILVIQNLNLTLTWVIVNALKILETSKTVKLLLLRSICRKFGDLVIKILVLMLIILKVMVHSCLNSWK